MKRLIVETRVDQMVKEKSGVFELPFKVLTFLEIEYSKLLILISLDARRNIGIFCLKYEIFFIFLFCIYDTKIKLVLEICGHNC